jgi:hypothetical protein
MMLKQTMEVADRKAVCFPGNDRSAVQLGSFRDMVFQRYTENSIEFAYQWTLPKAMSFRDSLHQKEYVAKLIKFSGSIGSGDHRIPKSQVNRFEYDMFCQSGGEQVSVNIGMERSTGKRVEYKLFSDGYNLKREVGRVWNPSIPIRFYGFPDEIVAYYKNANFVQELNLRHELLFSSISYLGPLRTKTERFYQWVGDEPVTVGFSGENAIAALIAASHRKFNFAPKCRLQSFQQVIASKLKQMGLIEEFIVSKVNEYRQEYEVKVRSRGSADFVDLPDVGFGISQVLPVLVQSFYAPANSIIIMEQPEIHLHPSAQAELADVLISVIHSRENSTCRNIQLIIETHSEHFLKRLQRRIAEGVIDESQVAAYFAQRETSSSNLKELDIDDYGNIRYWPKNFFGDEMTDAIAHAEAIAARKSSPKRGEED